MERVAVLGLSVHGADLETLERVRSRGDAREIADGLAASELVLLATCNRYEIYYARESGVLPGPRDVAALAEVLGVESHVLRSLTAGAAARHLFRVIASLDSLVVGEPQIVAQVRGALTTSRAVGLTGPLLEPMFEAGLKVGKRVRAETELGHHSVSVAVLGAAALRAKLDGHDTPAILVLGAGRTARLAAHALRDAGLPPRWIANRTAARAAALAAEVGGMAMSLDEFAGMDSGLDAIVAATGSPGVVVDGARLAAIGARTPSGRALVCLDLALPRDLESVRSERVDMIDLESLRGIAARNRDHRAAAIADAERVVERRLHRFLENDLERRFARGLSDVMSETSERFEREVSALARGRLAHLSEDDRTAVERWARVTFGRLAHAPLAACKHLAREMPALFEVAEEETVG